jgi:rare lipoprotein A
MAGDRLWPVRFRPGIHTAMAAGVMVASSCAKEPRVIPPSMPAPPFSAPSPIAPVIETGFATYYARRFAGRQTANGERYDPLQLTAAHPTLPFGTMVEVRRSDGRRVTVRVNDRGPYGSGRIIDLSRRAAEELGIVHDGKAWVELRRVGSPQPTVRDGRRSE